MRVAAWGSVCLALMLTACQSSARGVLDRPFTAISVPSCEHGPCSSAIPMLPADAPPHIVRLFFPSGLNVGRNEVFSGTISTSSNVASVEVRTNLFSINAKKTAIGRFTFAVDVYDVPPIFIRSYVLRVIARNTRGDETEEDVPLRIR